MYIYQVTELNEYESGNNTKREIENRLDLI